MIKIGINGFGRIGKAALRASLEKDMGVEIVAINSTSGPEKHAHLFKYDTNYGVFHQEVTAQDHLLRIGEKQIPFTSHRDPADIPWASLGVEVVLECSGHFLSYEAAARHLQGGAKKVILSAPGKGEGIKTIVMGVNVESYHNETEHILSNASCTTNCLAPIVKVLHDSFYVESALMTTVHAYTNDQRILDLPHSDLRRARAAAESIIPTTTGAAKAVELVIPSLKGKINGIAMRVPVPVVSIVDVVAQLKRAVTVAEVNHALKSAAQGHMKGILGYTELPLVSVDYKKDPRSAIVDGLSTMLVKDKMVKVVAWYDNEWGYSNRLLELAAYVGNQ